MEISDRINSIDRILKDSALVPVNVAVHGADGIRDGCTNGARGYGGEFPVPGLIPILLALPLGHHRGQHLGEGPYRRPPGPRFFADRGHAMVGHRVGFLGHCQFLPCLESVPVDCERSAGI